MLAGRWRKVLLGGTKSITIIRLTNLESVANSKDGETIRRDIVRTYPTNPWFTPHIGKLSNILNLYAYTNNGMGYAQGMAFIVFILYKVYHDDNPKHADKDTFYSFHKIINTIRPIYPLNKDDVSASVYVNDLKQLVYMKIAVNHRRLALRLKSMPDIIPLVIYQCIPTLFGNKFNVDDAIIIYDFIFMGECTDMFHRAICILCAIFISFEPVILTFQFEKVLEFIAVKEYYNVRKIISIAYTLL